MSYNLSTEKMYYILEDKIPVRCNDMFVWSQFMGTNRAIAYQIVGEYRVATIFTGIDYSSFARDPIVFETIIVNEVTNRPVKEFQTRCSSYREALEMQEIALEWLDRCFLQKNN